MPERPRVFISYSHDSEAHKAQVRDLADRLRADGVDCTIDQYVTDPAEGWRAWSELQIEEADFVLLVCTETYFRRSSRRERPGAGLGATFESELILQELYEAGMRNEKFLPVLFDADARVIPRALRSYTTYRIDTGGNGYQALLRRLTGQSPVRKPEIGTRKEPSPVVAGTGETPRRWIETRVAAIGRTVLRRWRWSVPIALLACAGLAGIWWWTAQEPSRHYRKGLQAMAALELLAAKEHLEEAVRSGKELPLERSALAVVLLQLGERDDAWKQANRAFNASATLPVADRLLVEARHATIAGNGPEAVRKYQQLLKDTKPPAIEHALGLADAQMALGQYQSALTTIETAQKASDDPRLDLSEALVAYRVGAWPRQLAAADRAIAEAKGRGFDQLAAAGLLLRGVARQQLGQSDRAVEDFLEVERRSRENNPQQAAKAQNGVAGIRYLQGDLNAAEQWYRRAQRSYQDVGDQDGVAAQQQGLGMIQTERLGKLADVREEYEKQLDTSDRSARAAALAELGWISYQQGVLPAATERLQEAIGIYEETGELESKAFQLCRLARVYADALELGAAKTTLASCRESADKVGGYSVADAMTAHGILLLFQGDLEHAWEAHQGARKIFEDLGWRRETAWSQLELAQIQLERQLAPEASSLIEPALDYFSQQLMANDEALAQVASARAHLAQGATSKAQSLVDAAKERGADSELLELRVQVALVEAEALAATGKVPEARDVVQRQLDDPAVRKYPRLRLQARLTQAEIETAHGDSGRGRDLLSRVEADAEVRGYKLVAARAARLLASR